MIKILTKIRVPAGWIYFILVAAVGNIKVGNIKNVWALFFIFLGEFIRTLSAGIIKKNQSLSSTGIYGIIRHPLYLGSFLIGMGFAVLVNSIFIWLYFLIFFISTYIVSINSEEQYLSGEFGNTFMEYKRTVPCFIPLSVKALKKSTCAFSYRQFKENHEYKNYFIICFVLVVLFLKFLKIQ